MEEELKKAEHLIHKDPERAMEFLSAIGAYLHFQPCAVLSQDFLNLIND